MEFARGLLMVTVILRWVAIGFFVSVIIHLLRSQLDRAGASFQRALFSVACSEVLLSLLIPFAVENGVLPVPETWNKSAGFHLANGAAMFAVLVYAHFRFLKKQK